MEREGRRSYHGFCRDQDGAQRVGSPPMMEVPARQPLPSIAQDERCEAGPASAGPSPEPPSSSIGRSLLWSAVTLVHLLCALFYAASAFLYHRVPTTVVALNVRAFGLSIDTKEFPRLVLLHALGVLVHTYLLLEMLLYSVMRKRLVFTYKAFLQQRKPSKRQHQSHQQQRRFCMLSLRAIKEASLARWLVKLKQDAPAYWSRWFGHDGVDQSYFRSLFLIRELGEIALQTYQAFKMSRLVPRVWLNQLYVALIASSCWSTPVLEYLYRKQHTRRGLRMCLFVDVVLDFISTVGIPTLLSIPYLKGYDPRSQDFGEDCWNSDIWYMNMVNEFQLLFIQSWADCFSRGVCCASLLFCLDDVKILALCDDDGGDGTEINRNAVDGGEIVFESRQNPRTGLATLLQSSGHPPASRQAQVGSCYPSTSTAPSESDGRLGPRTDLEAIDIELEH